MNSGVNFGGVCEVGGDGGIVLGGAGVGSGGEFEAEGVGGLAVVGPHLIEDFVVLGGVCDDDDGAVVFGGGADHGGTADVDVFDRFGEGAIWLGNGGFERVKVDADKVDGLDVVLFHGGEVGGVVAEGEETAVDEGVEGFDAAVHHFGEAGEIGDVFHGETSITEGFGGAAGGDEFDVEFGLEGLGECDDAGLVGDAEEGSLDADEIGGGGLMGGRDLHGVPLGFETFEKLI